MKIQEDNILEKYIHGTISEEEYNELKQNLSNHSDQQVAAMLETYWQEDKNLYAVPKEITERIHSKIDRQIQGDIRRKLFRKVAAVAAAVLLPVFIASTFYFQQEKNRYKRMPQLVSVDKGQKAGITLPDGSIVQLNSESKLSYTLDFNGEMREVTLEGEAYFQVKPDKSKPFIVKTAIFDVEVLGTSFNVSAYHDDCSTETALVEGKVKLTMNHSDGRRSKPVYLSPSQKFVYSKANHKGTISLMHGEYELAWKQGILMFNAEPLEEVFKKIERWYGMSIHFDKKSIAKDHFTGQFKSIPIQEMMNILRMHYNLNYKIEKENIYIM